jgi:hypothetical protein|nr:MAG TPA: hypothetical protein [Caudoviricetes sp.]
MLVKELIEKLKEMPQEALVMHDYDCELVPVDKVETYSFEGTIAVELSTDWNKNNLVYMNNSALKNR